MPLDIYAKKIYLKIEVQTRNLHRMPPLYISMEKNLKIQLLVSRMCIVCDTSWHFPLVSFGCISRFESSYLRLKVDTSGRILKGSESLVQNLQEENGSLY